MAGTNNTVIVAFSITMFLLLILLLIVTYNSKCQIDNVERFNSSNSLAYLDMQNRTADAASQGIGNIRASDPLGNETFRPVQQVDVSQTPEVQETQKAAQCTPRDRLTSADLLPLDANSKWAELNPQCGGDIQDQNYLTAGYHIGINTVGQSMRNANLQLRYEPPNPQIPVSPWQIRIIEPDQRVHGLLDSGSAPVYS